MNKAEAEKWLENRGYLGTNFPINIVMEIMVEYAQQVSIGFVRFLMDGKPMLVGEKTDHDIGALDIEEIFSKWYTNHQNQQ